MPDRFRPSDLPRVRVVPGSTPWLTRGYHRAAAWSAIDAIDDLDQGTHPGTIRVRARRPSTRVTAAS